MRVDIQNHPELTKHIGMGMQVAMVKALHSTALRLVQHINVQVIPSFAPRAPVDRGLYRAGWRVDVQPGIVYIVNTVKQSVFIEDGVRAEKVKPGKAMIEALAGWVKRKGMLSGGNPKGPDVEAKGIAWAVAKSMQKKGIFKGTESPSGFRVAARAMLSFGKFMNEEMARELKKQGL